MKLYAKFHPTGLILEIMEVEDSVLLPEPYVLQTPEVYAEWKSKQDVVPPVLDPEPEPVVSVTNWQMCRALNHLGLRAQVEAVIAQADQDTKDAWLRQPTFNRYHPIILGLIAALGWSEQQADEVFSLAATFQ